MKSFSVIKETQDYSLFRMGDTNREVKEQRDLYEDIQVNGVEIPIAVTSDFYVVDGQHRLEYAKRLGKIVPYFIVYNLTVKDAARLNCKRSNWTLLDYLKSHSKEGKQDYTHFLDVYDRHKFTIGYLLKLANTSIKSMKEGSMGFGSGARKRFQQKVGRILPLWEINSKTRSLLAQQKILPALLLLINADNYDEAHAIKQFKKYPHKLKSTSGGVEARQMLEDIYNCGVSKSKRVKL